MCDFDLHDPEAFCQTFHWVSFIVLHTPWMSSLTKE
jgi:hypothetical protein